MVIMLSIGAAVAPSRLPSVLICLKYRKTVDSDSKMLKLTAQYKQLQIEYEEMHHKLITLDPTRKYISQACIQASEKYHTRNQAVVSVIEDLETLTQDRIDDYRALCRSGEVGRLVLMERVLADKNAVILTAGFDEIVELMESGKEELSQIGKEVGRVCRESVLGELSDKLNLTGLWVVNLNESCFQ